MQPPWVPVGLAQALPRHEWSFHAFDAKPRPGGARLPKDGTRGGPLLGSTYASRPDKTGLVREHRGLDPTGQPQLTEHPRYVGLCGQL